MVAEPIKLSDILGVKLKSWRDNGAAENGESKGRDGGGKAEKEEGGKEEKKSKNTPAKPKPAWMEKLIKKNKEKSAEYSFISLLIEYLKGNIFSSLI